MTINLHPTCHAFNCIFYHCSVFWLFHHSVLLWPPPWILKIHYISSGLHYEAYVSPSADGFINSLRSIYLDCRTHQHLSVSPLCTLFLCPYVLCHLDVSSHHLFISLMKHYDPSFSGSAQDIHFSYRSKSTGHIMFSLMDALIQSTFSLVDDIEVL